MRKVEITYQLQASLTAVARIRDGRYKSGYREVKDLAIANTLLDSERSSYLEISGIYNLDNKMQRIQAFVPVTFGKLASKREEI